MNQKNKKTISINWGTITLIIVVSYFTLAVSFNFLSGDQLKFRDSRGNIAMEIADSSPVELREGITISQNFCAQIQRIQSITVKFGTFYRENSGIITIELCTQQNDEVLMSGTFSAADIIEGQCLTISAPEPIENFYNVPLTIRMYSNSKIGAGIAPLVASTMPRKDGSLFLNEDKINGVLCFSVSGSDYIWTGLYYWHFVAGFGAFLALLMLITWKRYDSGRHSYIINGIMAVKKYRFLITQLVSRDFKTKYKRSVLGMLWSFLNPLLMMSVQYFIFSTLFSSDIPHYQAYLLVGIITFNFFSEACGMCLTSIVGNASLITKVYVPKYIYPLTRLISSTINLGISLIPLLLVIVLTGLQLQKAAILALFFWACLIVFSLGLGLLLSASMVFFRDTQFLWGILSTIWMYATPIFYPESIIPDRFKFISVINPLCHFLKNARLCILSGISPEPIMYVQCFLIALAMLCVGALVFRKAQDKFVLYL